MNLPPAVAGITKSDPLTDVPKYPVPCPDTIAAKSTPFSITESPAPLLSAIQMPKKVPTKAPIAVMNCEVMASRFENPDLTRME